MSTYVTTAQWNSLRSTLNSFVSWVKEFKANHESKFETYKKSINGLVDTCITLQESLSSLSNSSSEPSTNTSTLPEDAVEKINACIMQLNTTINYLEHWADAGNLTMKDVRDSVGEQLSLIEPNFSF